MKKSLSLSIVRKNRAIGYKLKYLYYCIKKRKMLQKKVRFGNANPGKTVYIVKPDNNDGIEGLLSLLARTSLYIRHAKKHGYQVFVDWKNYHTQYENPELNAWELFFEQPSSLTIEEVYTSKNAILSGWTFLDINPHGVFSKKQIDNKAVNLECYNLLTQNVTFNKEIQRIVHDEAVSLDIEACLGVYIRGTDYVKLQPSGEYVQPDVNMLIEKISDFLKKYKDVDIFLVTEDGEIYDRIKDTFGEKVKTVSFDTHIYNYSGNDFLSKSGALPVNRSKNAINYLVKMILLSKCKYFIGSITMGSMFSYGLNGNKYEYSYLFDLGLYK